MPYQSLQNKSLKAYSIRTGDASLPDDLEPHVVNYVSSIKRRYSDARQEIEQYWNEAWALYLGTPQAVEGMRAQILKTVGDVNVDWRHRINVGKAFEAVETIHGYLMAATFPNQNWFSVEPMEPSSIKLARVVQKYVVDKFEKGNFRAHYENFLRQCIITGNSVMALPWRYETQKYKKKVRVAKRNSPDAYEVLNLDEDTEYEWQVVEETRVTQNHPDFEVLDIFDCFFDTNVKDPNEAPFLRRIYKTKAEVCRCIEDGYYLDVPLTQVQNTGSYGKQEGQQVDRYSGVTNSVYDPTDIVEVWEYWGDVVLQDITYKDVVVTILGDNTLLRFETNPYWAGRPFVVGTFIPVLQTYAMGAIQPNAGLLHELNIVTNQRLDNLELSIDQMWTVKADGLLQPNEVYTEPGKVFLVADHTDIAPLAGHTADYPITYQESGVLEAFIDKNFGTGALIGSGQPRGGERVTAQEIQAVRDAGGNRLSNLHKHLEETALLPLLGKVLRLMQQYVERDEIVKIATGIPGVSEYYQIGSDALNKSWNLKPLGADFIAGREKFIKNILDFLSAVTQVPQMAQRLNYDAILRDLVTHFGFDDPDKYLTIPDQQAPQVLEATGGAQPGQPQAQGMPGTPPQPGQDIAQQLHSMGGQPLVNAVNTDAQVGGANALLTKYLGQAVPPELGGGAVQPQQVLGQ